MVGPPKRALVRGGTNSSNERFPKKGRILALEIRPRRLGFVVFEEPTQLLDWGIRTYGRPENEVSAVVAKKIDILLNLYTPFMIVLQPRRGPTLKTGESIAIVMRTIQVEAEQHSIKFEFVTKPTVRRFFIQYGVATKHQIASLLAEWFEDLSWKLPPKRKPWQSEDHNMPIFDAAATGMTFFDVPRNVEGQVLQSIRNGPFRWPLTGV
jgi:hypothetical protein